MLVCEPVLNELERVLQTKLRVPAAVAADFCRLLRAEGEMVSARQAPTCRIDDADDEPIVALALGGKAELFVTGDKALLELAEVDGMPVISPRELWTRLTT